MQEQSSTQSRKRQQRGVEPELRGHVGQDRVERREKCDEEQARVRLGDVQAAGEPQHAPEEKREASKLNEGKATVAEQLVRKPEQRDAAGRMVKERPVVLIAIEDATLDEWTFLEGVAVALFELSDEGSIDHLIALAMLAAQHGESQDEAEKEDACDKPPAQTYETAG